MDKIFSNPDMKGSNIVRDCSGIPVYKRANRDRYFEKEKTSKPLSVEEWLKKQDELYRKQVERDSKPKWWEKND
jgi:hypothetical protein